MDRAEAQFLVRQAKERDERLKLISEKLGRRKAAKAMRAMGLVRRLVHKAEDKTQATRWETEQFHAKQLETYKNIRVFLKSLLVAEGQAWYTEGETEGPSPFGTDALFTAIQSAELPMGELDDGTALTAQFSVRYFDDLRHYSSLMSQHSQWHRDTPYSYGVTLKAKLPDAEEPMVFREFRSSLLYHSAQFLDSRSGPWAMSAAEADTTVFEDISDCIEMCKQNSTVELAKIS